MKLHEVAHSRTGDKGNISTVSVICFQKSNYEMIKNQLTEENVKKFFSGIGVTNVERYELPKIGALNFILFNSLGGGVTKSVALDAHGKTLSSFLLNIEMNTNS